MDISGLLKNIRQEEDRNNAFLHLTANENQMSETARSFLNAKISERYFMGPGEAGIVDFGHFTALGFPSAAALIDAGKEAAKSMLGASDVNLSVLSGVHAMMSAILATTEPGDAVMTVPLEWGGHFATKGILERVGRRHVFAAYDYPNLRFDAETIGKIAKKEHVRALYLDVSYYLNPHNLKELREVLGEDVLIIYDASHTMGLIMGHTFQDPFVEGADVICANTHKTLPGPHKGMIAFKDPSLARKANAIIDGCLYSTPHMTHLIALSVTLLEMKEFGSAYARQIIENSNAIAKAFAQLGYDVRRANTGRYSENHQAHVFIDTKGEWLTLYRGLIQNGISTNFENSELSGGRAFIRIGTAEVTRRGMKEADMVEIASLMDRAMKGENVKDSVLTLAEKHKRIHFSFDP